MIPKEICDDIRALVLKLGVTTQPKYLPCKPDMNALVNECFPNVERKVKSDGGKSVLGWQIWKTPLLVEAELHAVWQSPDGDLTDITPKSFPLNRILFVYDESAIYIGKQVNNIRINITGNQLVDDFIALNNVIFRIENKGERAFQHMLKLSGTEAKAYDQLKKLGALLEWLVLQGMNRKSPCFCGSGKKHKYCHGKKISKLLVKYNK